MIQRPSPDSAGEQRDQDRVDIRAPYLAPCPHFPNCVGCAWINIPYPVQLARKREMVQRALIEYSSVAHVEVPAVVPSPERLGYRSRVKLVVRRSRREVAAGLYRPHSHHVVDISSCAVHPRPVNQVLSFLKKKIHELGIAPYDERDDSGELRYLDLRYSFARRELNVTLVTRRSSLLQGGLLAKALQHRFAFVTGVVQNVNEERGNVIWGDRYRTLGGRDSLMEQIGDLKMVFPAGVFSQANPFTARKIYQHVCELAQLNGNEIVLDLYCGVGPISLYLAPAARQIWAVDDSESSIRTAKQNARRNGRGNCRFIAGDVGATLARWSESLPDVDLIVLNPPRKGLESQAMSSLLAVRAARIIYVSCEPKSLARDLDQLVRNGYRVTHSQPFDMLPQTEQVEIVAQLER